MRWGGRDFGGDSGLVTTLESLLCWTATIKVTSSCATILSMDRDTFKRLLGRSICCPAVPASILFRTCILCILAKKQNLWNKETGGTSHSDDEDGLKEDPGDHYDSQRFSDQKNADFYSWNFTEKLQLRATRTIEVGSRGSERQHVSLFVWSRCLNQSRCDLQGDRGICMFPGGYLLHLTLNGWRFAIRWENDMPWECVFWMADLLHHIPLSPNISST